MYKKNIMKNLKFMKINTKKSPYLTGGARKNKQRYLILIQLLEDRQKEILF